MGYDINPHYGFVNVGWTCPLSALTMWDSIEHIHEPFSLIKRLNPEWLFLATPNLESVKGPVTEWKHYRPYEHVHYFDRHSLDFHLKNAGYALVETNFDEGALRDPANPEAILTAVARRADLNSKT